MMTHKWLISKWNPQTSKGSILRDEVRSQSEEVDEQIHPLLQMQPATSLIVTMFLTGFGLKESFPKDEFNLKQSNSASNGCFDATPVDHCRICDRCLAQTGKNCVDAMNYRNFGSDAAWPLTGIDHQTYLHMDSANISPWSLIEGWEIETVSFDLLHNLLLGTARDIIGSGIRTLIHRGIYSHVGSDDLDLILDAVHREMHKTCAENGCL